ncbi:hypothetical protein [Hydrocarboniphaga sp.]|uniref:hypothetical protein n=1 Tax=Hydrocarboniphaga sp. TaxID=2033016 RepID=UPI00262F2AA5|nr:hypothetical protein [Hydrocarboniphaga sp.]
MSSLKTSANCRGGHVRQAVAGSFNQPMDFGAGRLYRFAHPTTWKRPGQQCGPAVQRFCGKPSRVWTVFEQDEP